MNTQLRPESGENTRLRLVDCDIHPAQRTAGALYPYLERRWVDHLESFGTHIRQALVGQLAYPRMSDGGMRVDAKPEDGPAGSSLELMREQHLDPLGIEIGHLIALGRGGMEERNPELSAAMARAVNDWQLAEWLEPEPRLRGGIVVPQDVPEKAVAEIERHADDPRFVQVIMSTRPNETIGARKYWPIYRAAEAAGLPVGLHPAGYSSGKPSTGGGWPSFYFQEHYTFVPGSQALVTSLVIEGVLEAFPRLKVAIIEGGFSWAPALGWRMDRHFDTFRKEVPHLKMKPSEYMKRHFWWATQPMEEPKNGRHVEEVIDWIGWDRILYSSDYPHWDYDNPNFIFKFPLDPERRAAVFGGNARALYGHA
ncbi:amidohydrolase family protein [Psychromarinibacter sp. C21-152]|uniref:Amidohydrolase family protein n=1 Tax=Psychromarinibacter sediminicola TaxID=3033385 RepID=A0AAE3NW37_9RHOB|nr:amidohydrolase family protein [Psychromarinibacter sediminicola]MDF0602010.1 amidohydrolase family protein [Psychromarinibacter sediminicola]